jgi:hypothetical protein
MRVVEHSLGFEHAFLGRLEHRVHAPDHAHGQDDIGVFASLEEIPQDVVGIPQMKETILLCVA